MSIPDKSVEAGGRIIAEHQSAYEHLDETNRALLAKAWEPAARAVLEAAEPYLTGVAAAELREAADAIESVWEGIEQSDQPFTPGHAARQLRARATDLEVKS